MLRLMLIVLVLAALSLGATWLAETPGNVTVQWLGYEIHTSFAFLMFAVFISLLTGITVYHLLSSIFRLPSNMSKSRAIRHHQEGLKVLTEAIAAITVAEYDTAQRLTRKAEKLLDTPPLTLLLSAQLSRLKGEDDKAKEYLEEMLKNPETEYLAMRGLIENARKHGDYYLALAHAERAYASRSGNKWVVQALIDLYSHLGRWQEALLLVEKAYRRRVFDKQELKRYLAIIHYQHGKKMLAQGEISSAQQFFVQSHAKQPPFVPAALALAQMKIENQQREEAAKIIQATWKFSPHPALADAYLDIYRADKPDLLTKRVIRLVKPNPSHTESRIILARAAILAADWDLARTQLSEVLSSQENTRACKLMSEIEQKQFGNAANSHQWLVRATSAAPDPEWVCGNCGHSAAEWHIHCDECGAFDTIEWKVKTYAYLGRHGSSTREIAIS